MTSKINRKATCARKKPYDSLEYAELVADKIALSEWQRGVDKRLRVYKCQVCGKYHVGTMTKRRRFQNQIPLHEYKHLKVEFTLDEEVIFHDLSATQTSIRDIVYKKAKSENSHLRNED